MYRIFLMLFAILLFNNCSKEASTAPTERAILGTWQLYYEVAKSNGNIIYENKDWETDPNAPTYSFRSNGVAYFDEDGPGTYYNEEKIEWELTNNKLIITFTITNGNEQYYETSEYIISISNNILSLKEQNVELLPGQFAEVEERYKKI